MKIIHKPSIMSSILLSTPMETAYYTSATVLLVILMIAMTIHVVTYSGFVKKQKVWFVLTFAAISFCALAEYAIHCGYYNPGLKIPLTILTVLQFAIAPTFAMLFAGALGLRHQRIIAYIVFGVGLTIGTISAPFGWIFYFDDAGYHRGVAFLTYEILYFGSLIYIIGSLVIVGKKFHHRDIGTIVMVLVMITGGIIPMTFASLHVAYIAVGMSSTLCYVFYNDLMQQDTRDELIKNQERISSYQGQIISRLANLIESRDAETGGHVARTSEYCKVLAEQARKEGLYQDQIDDAFIERIYALAPIHDVGKILVSDKILRKPGRLTSEEYEEMKQHASLGEDIAKRILGDMADENYLSTAYDIATYHHERYDGGGYPKGLSGNEIPLSARIMAIADVFDALASKRVYKPPMPFEKAVSIIQKDAGTHFDPKCVEAFMDSLDEVKRVHEQMVGTTIEDL